MASIPRASNIAQGPRTNVCCEPDRRPLMLPRPHGRPGAAHLAKGSESDSEDPPFCASARARRPHALVDIEHQLFSRLSCC